MRVSVHQGDLDNPIATRLLFDRIEEAAMEVCGASPFSFPTFVAPSDNPTAGGKLSPRLSPSFTTLT